MFHQEASIETIKLTKNIDGWCKRRIPQLLEKMQNFLLKSEGKFIRGLEIYVDDCFKISPTVIIPRPLPEVMVPNRSRNFVLIIIALWQTCLVHIPVHVLGPKMVHSRARTHEVSSLDYVAKFEPLRSKILMRAIDIWPTTSGRESSCAWWMIKHQLQ